MNPATLNRLNVRSLTGTVLEVCEMLYNRNVIDYASFGRVKRLASPVDPLRAKGSVLGLDNLAIKDLDIRCTWDPDCQAQAGAGFWYWRVAGTENPLDPWFPLNWNPEPEYLDQVQRYMRNLAESY